MGIREIGRLLKFLAGVRFRNYFSGKWKAFKFIAMTLLFVNVLIYIFLSDFLIRAQLQNKIQKFDSVSVITISLILMVLIKDNLPSYKRHRNMAAPFYPINYMISNLISIIYELTSPFYVFVVIYLVGLHLVNSYFTSVDLLLTLSFVLYSYCLDRLVKTSVERNFDISLLMQILKVIFLVMLLAGSVTTMIFHALPKLYTTIIVVGITLFIFGRAVSQRGAYIASIHSHARIRTNIYLSMIMGNGALRSSLFFAFLYKLIILGVFTLVWQVKHRAFMPWIFYWLLISPAGLFSYFLNNFIGFARELFLSFELSGSKMSTFSGIYYKTAIVILPTDMALSLPALFINGQIRLESLLFYFGSFISLTVIGLVLSFRFAKSIPKRITLQLSNQNVPVSSNLISGLIVVILYFLMKEGFVFEVALLFMSLFFVFVSPVYLNTLNVRLRHEVYQRLFPRST